MKIRLLSDLHLEGGDHPELYANKGEDVLVLAGDIHTGGTRICATLSRFAEQTKDIVYVMGNHEAYHHDYDEIVNHLTSFCRHSNIHFLNPDSVKIGDVTFIGGTLWSNFRKDVHASMAAKSGINDFRVITGMNVHRCARLYEEHIAYIKYAYEHTEGNKVIVSHFLPAVECIAKQYRGPDLINYYFANDLGNWISELTDVPYWLFGHTHDNVDLMIGDVNLVANPYGYGWNRYYTEKLLEIK